MDIKALDLPALLAALAAAYAAYSASKARKEVKSPNGTTTGEAVHALTQSVDLVLARQVAHELSDSARFAEAAEATEAAANEVREELGRTNVELNRRLDSLIGRTN